MQRFLAPLLLLCVAVPLAGCGSVNPVIMAKLAAADPLAAEPGDIQMAAVLPKQIRLRSGDPKLTVAAESRDGSWKERQVFDLEVAELPGSGKVSFDADRQHVVTARVASGDLERLRALQLKAKALKAAGRSGKGAIGVGVAGGCLDAPLPQGVLAVSILLRMEKSGDFLPVTGPFDLRKLEGGKVAAAIRPCA